MLYGEGGSSGWNFTSGVNIHIFFLWELASDGINFSGEWGVLKKLIVSLSMQRFWGTDGNRKWTFRTPGQWSFLDFQTNGLYYWKETEQCKCGGVKTS